jgi:hypothetical protein
LFRTSFGKLELASPRLRRCPCQHGGQASISPLVELLPERAHLLLQTRTRTLNGDLAETFRRWYPTFSLEDQAVDDTHIAA